jgi:uncharacterized RDD family membrane protein YckC
MEKDLLTEDLLSEDDLPTEEYALLIDRVQSMFIDLVFIIVMMFVITAVLDRFGDPPDWVRIVLFFGLWAIYEPLCTMLGCTLGQYIKKLRVRDFQHPSRRINIFRAFIRYILKTLLGWFSFLTIHASKERRAIHDHVSGSVMLKAK